ncbi:hypothetical protein [Bacillus tuaregi]|uniref:hypothetical protein n=1 Tax=Bacillus tuaregi TaxID=1816695 RepID=UPI0008F871B8|nr:hypothetical protein [Bacillus tuaregi]
MPRKPNTNSLENIDDKAVQEEHEEVKNNKKNEDEIEGLNRMLGAVLQYLSDDEVEEIDIEYLLENTEGLREWWNQYRERNRKQLEDEIKKSLGDLSLEELENIREQVIGKNH